MKDRLTFTLEADAVLDLQAILLDNDEEAALSFVKEHIAAKIPVSGDSPCDSSKYNPYLIKPGGLK